MRLAFSFNPINTKCMEIDQHRAAILIHILQIVGDISLYLLVNQVGYFQVVFLCKCSNVTLL